MSSWKTSYLHCYRHQNKQRSALKLCIYMAYTQVSKLGLHPEMLPSLAYFIKLFEITMKMKIGLLKSAYFCYMYFYMFYALTKWYFDRLLASSLNLADLLFFIYNVSHNSFYNYFLSEYIIFDFWNVEF